MENDNNKENKSMYFKQINEIDKSLKYTNKTKQKKKISYQK